MTARTVTLRPTPPTCPVASSGCSAGRDEHVPGHQAATRGGQAAGRAYGRGFHGRHHRPPCRNLPTSVRHHRRIRARHQPRDHHHRLRHRGGHAEPLDGVGADRRLHAARQLVRADAGARRPAREPHPDLRLRPSSVQSDGRSAGRGGNWHCELGL